MHYSIIPLEMVFENEDKIKNNIEINYLGARVEVLELPNNKYQIMRIISTQPKMYLNPMLMPGMIIEPKL